MRDVCHVSRAATANVAEYLISMTTARKIEEAMPDAMRIEPKVAADAIEQDAMDASLDVAHKAFFKFDEAMLKPLLNALRGHATGGVAWTRRDLEDINEDMQEEITELQMECVHEISEKLVEYAQRYVTMVAEAIVDLGQA